MGVKMNRASLVAQIDAKLKSLQAELLKVEAKEQAIVVQTIKKNIKLYEVAVGKAIRLCEREKYKEADKALMAARRSPIPMLHQGYGRMHSNPTSVGITAAIGQLKKLKNAVALTVGEVIELPSKTFDEIARCGIEALL